MAIAIYEKRSGQRLFDLTEEQLDQIIDVLEEEDERDHDYWIDAAVCEFLDGKVDAEVVAKLRAALPAGAAPVPSEGDGIEVAGADEPLPAVEGAGDGESDEEYEEDEEDAEAEEPPGDGVTIVWRSE
jgi:hypothetical protein